MWITLIKNIAADHLPTHGAAFHAVHYVLAAIALLLDVGVSVIGVRGWRAAGRRAPDPAAGEAETAAGEPETAAGRRSAGRQVI